MSTTEAAWTQMTVALEARDKTSAVAAIRLIEQTFAPGYHPGRHHLRTIECSIDIGNWGTARVRAQEASRALRGDMPGLPATG